MTSGQDKIAPSNSQQAVPEMDAHETFKLSGRIREDRTVRTNPLNTNDLTWPLARTEVARQVSQKDERASRAVARTQDQSGVALR
jgi:hypothetical protein